jgi:predicted small secreted protein
MKALLFLPLAMATLLLSGCNTIKGVGEDISGSANWTQEKMSGIGGGSSASSSDSQYVKNPPEFPKAN